MMDWEIIDIMGAIMAIFILLIMILGLLAIFHLAFISPVNADTALKYCNNKGYSSYEDYQDRFLSYKIYAIRCKDIPLTNNSIGISIAK